jgi:hypothetical protein
MNVSINVGVSINAKGRDCWTIGCHWCQPLELSRYPRVMIDIDHELVVIDFNKNG